VQAKLDSPKNYWKYEGWGQDRVDSRCILTTHKKVIHSIGIYGYTFTSQNMECTAQVRLASKF